MPEGQPLEFSGVTKRFGAVTAVSGLTARIEPGRVTGFLGPNGAGKTTTLRILLGLVRATEGHATIGGERYGDLSHPLQTVGAVLEASSFHPGRTAAAHLRVYAQAARISNGRVDEVLGLVGLADAANRKVGGFSLGMRQRLGLAYALLGDPGVLVLDEPANGLDPEGIRWMRGFLRDLAREGRTVLVSSHLLTEVQQTVDALLIISQGRLVFEGSLDELADPSEYATVVDAPDRSALTAALRSANVPFEVLRSGLTVRGVEPAAVGAAAAAGGVALSSLHRRGPALEEVFLDLVNGVRVHASAAGAVGGGEVPTGEVVAEQRAPVTETDAAAQPTEHLEVAEAEAPAEPIESADSVAGEAEPNQTTEPAEPDEQPEPAEPDQLAMTNPGNESSDPGEEAPGSTAHANGSAAFAVASTGIIDIVPDAQARPDADPDTSEGSDDPPPDADPDVEELGAIDDELSVPEPAEEDDARPWENREKTDADLEADRFFAAFDASVRQSSNDGGEAGEPEAEASVDEEVPQEPARHAEEGDQR